MGQTSSGDLGASRARSTALPQSERGGLISFPSPIYGAGGKSRGDRELSREISITGRRSPAQVKGGEKRISTRALPFSTESSPVPSSRRERGVRLAQTFPIATGRGDVDALPTRKRGRVVPVTTPRALRRARLLSLSGTPCAERTRVFADCPRAGRYVRGCSEECAETCELWMEEPLRLLREPPEARTFPAGRALPAWFLDVQPIAVWLGDSPGDAALPFPGFRGGWPPVPVGTAVVRDGEYGIETETTVGSGDAASVEDACSALRALPLPKGGWVRYGFVARMVPNRPAVSGRALARLLRTLSFDADLGWTAPDRHGRAGALRWVVDPDAPLLLEQTLRRADDGVLNVTARTKDRGSGLWAVRMTAPPARRGRSIAPPQSTFVQAADPDAASQAIAHLRETSGVVGPLEGSRGSLYGTARLLAE